MSMNGNNINFHLKCKHEKINISNGIYNEKYYIHVCKIFGKKIKLYRGTIKFIIHLSEIINITKNMNEFQCEFYFICQN